MRSFNASQNQANQTSANANTFKTAKTSQSETNICQLINLENTQVSTGCFSRKTECENNGEIIRYILDYGNTGCNAGDQILVGKFI